MTDEALFDLCSVAGDVSQNAVTRWLAYHLLKREAGISHTAWTILRRYRKQHSKIFEKNKR